MIRNRRQFLAGSAAALSSSVVTAAQAAEIRTAHVGVGARSKMFREAILKNYPEHCQLVGFCDLNEGRLKLAQAHARDLGAGEVPGYAAADFDRPRGTPEAGH